MEAQGVVQQLGGTVAPCFDVVAGEAVVATVGRTAPAAVQVELVPGTEVVKIRAQTMQLELRNVRAEIQAEGGVLELTSASEGEIARVQVDRAGRVVPFRGAREGITDPQLRHLLTIAEHSVRTAPAAAGESTATAVDVGSEIAESRPEGGLPDVPQTAVEPVDRTEKDPRVTLAGRVGAAPHCRTSRNQTLVRAFPLLTDLANNFDHQLPFRCTPWHYGRSHCGQADCISPAYLPSCSAGK